MQKIRYTTVTYSLLVCTCVSCKSSDACHATNRTDKRADSSYLSHATRYSRSHLGKHGHPTRASLVAQGTNPQPTKKFY